jgi:hypothetical protein
VRSNRHWGTCPFLGSVACQSLLREDTIELPIGLGLPSDHVTAGEVGNGHVSRHSLALNPRWQGYGYGIEQHAAEGWGRMSETANRFLSGEQKILRLMTQANWAVRCLSSTVRTLKYKLRTNAVLMLSRSCGGAGRKEQSKSCEVGRDSSSIFGIDRCCSEVGAHATSNIMSCTSHRTEKLCDGANPLFLFFSYAPSPVGDHVAAETRCEPADSRPICALLLSNLSESSASCRP